MNAKNIKSVKSSDSSEVKEAPKAIAPPKIFAHRGYGGGFSASHKENTAEAFLEAKDAGADWVEFDVRRSSDGTLVCHHDAHLEDGRVVAETDSGDLPSDIPSLAEALEACDGMGVNIEIKNAPSDPDFDPTHEIAFSVAGVATAYVGYEMLLVSSFNFDTLTSIKNADAKISTGLLFFDPATALQNIERAKEGGHNVILPNISSVDLGFVEAAHSAGLSVTVWTVNEKEHILEMAELGVDGIITDEVSAAKKVLTKFAEDLG